MQKVTVIILSAVFITGCSIFRDANKSVPQNINENGFSASEILENNLTSEDFNIKRAEVSYSDENSDVSFIASLKYRKNGEWLASLRTKTGIEAARVFISHDTVLINDRINKRLYCGSYTYIERKYGVSADAIPLLVGDLVLKSSEDDYMLCIEGRSKIDTKLTVSNVSYYVDCRNRKSGSVLIDREIGENKILIRYTDYKSSGTKIYPEIIEIQESNGKSKLKIIIRNIELLPVDNLNFIPGNNYETIIIK